MWNPFQSRPVASRTRGRTKAKKREDIVSTEDSILVPDEPLTSEGRSKENEEMVDLCVGFGDDDDDVESSSSGPDDPVTSIGGEDNDDSDRLDYWAEEEEKEEEDKAGEAREVFNRGGGFGGRDRGHMIQMKV